MMKTFLNGSDTHSVGRFDHSSRELLQASEINRILPSIGHPLRQQTGKTGPRMKDFY